jgi:hypothetical protein
MGGNLCISQEYDIQLTVPRAMQLASDHEHTVRQASWYTKYGVVFTALLFLYTPTSSDPRRSPYACLHSFHDDNVF